MGRRELGAPHVALLGVLAMAACSRDEPADVRAPPPDPEAARPAPVRVMVRVKLPTPTADGPRATLHVALTGEHLTAVHGAGAVEVSGGMAVADTRRAHELAAHDRELQRLVIGSRAVLTHVPPNAALRLGDQPCFGWQLGAPWLDADGNATRPEDGGRCPASTRKTLADYRCPADAVADGYCCLRTAVLAFADGAERLLALTGPGGEAAELDDDHSLEVVPGGCGFYVAKTAAGEVGLAIGFGARWQLAIDEAGVVSGRQIAAP